jgi:monoamine oxidase
MARTPLLSALQRSLRIARRSLRSGREPAEIEARDAERVRSRRDFLAAGAAAAVSVSLSRCASLAPTSRRGERVIVIGAGIAGLSCAYRLRQAGIAVRVFEAQNRVGGRVSSLRGHFDDGQVAELGGELIDTGHAHLRRLARELGIPIDDLVTDVPDERSVWFFDGVRHPETEGFMEGGCETGERAAAEVLVALRRPATGSLLSTRPDAARPRRAAQP